MSLPFYYVSCTENNHPLLWTPSRLQPPLTFHSQTPPSSRLLVTFPFWPPIIISSLIFHHRHHLAHNEHPLPVLKGSGLMFLAGSVMCTRAPNVDPALPGQNTAARLVNLWSPFIPIVFSFASCSTSYEITSLNNKLHDINEPFRCIF
jgi:hypothetical protein